MEGSKISEAGEIRSVMGILDILILQRHVKEIERPNCYLEIGTKYGGSAMFSKIAAPEGVEVYSVDRNPRLWMWKKDPSEFGIHIIKGFSLEVVKEWNKPIGVLFIDGNHDEAAKDFHAWEKFAVKGGVIMFHDYGGKYLNVKRDCDEIIKENGFKLLFDPGIPRKKMDRYGRTSMFVIQKYE